MIGKLAGNVDMLRSCRNTNNDNNTTVLEVPTFRLSFFHRKGEFSS